ncbi:hypothetical protein FRC03_000780 [Tulasnella sp. 419]|nr:hypothetical protein FRC03_000780 [Tulasnella sp. 419]
MANTNADPQRPKEYSDLALELIFNTSEVAKKLKSEGSASSPLHLLYVFLYGNNVVTDINDIPDPVPPPFFWSMVERDFIPVKPSDILKEVHKRLTSGYQNGPAFRAALRPPTPDSTAASGSSPPKPSLFSLGLRQKLKGHSPTGHNRTLSSPSPDASGRSSPAPILDGYDAEKALLSVFASAKLLKQRMGDDYITPNHLLFALVKDEKVDDLLESFNVQPRNVIRILEERMNGPRVTRPDDEGYPNLAKYASNLVDQAKNRKLNEIIGRDEEIRRVIHILCRRTKNSAVLIGEPGVGKTAVAEGLAQRIADNQVPPSLHGTIYSLDMGALFAGAGKGEFEQRVKGIIDVKEPTVDEATTILRGIRQRYEDHHQVWILDQAIVTAVNLAHRYLTARRLPDSAVDLMDEACAAARVAQDMDPEAVDTIRKRIVQVSAHIQALEREATPEDGEHLKEKREEEAKLKGDLDIALRQQKKVKEWWESIAVLRDQLQRKKHELLNAKGSKTIEKDMKKLRDDLTKIEQKGPEVVGGSNDSVERILSRTSPNIITPESIAEVVEKSTKIPVKGLLSSDKDRLKNLESELKKKVIGQPEAISAVARAIQVSRTGLGNASRPVCSLLFTGPSGTGKTLLTKTLAQVMFGQSNAMIKIDGSEYSTSHSTSRLIGSPPGYVGYEQGGQLTEYVRRNPYCIVLLDEIEKTCSEFWTLFLQVLDEGRLTDGQGRLVDFRNCVIIMTSNLGGHELSEEKDAVSAKTRLLVNKILEQNFPIEFLNRIDEVIMFRTMSSQVLGQILDNHLAELQQREGIKSMKLDFDERAKEWLILNGTSTKYGARPLARVIQRELLNSLSQSLLDNKIQIGDTVVIRVSDNNKGLTITPKRNSAS